MSTRPPALDLRTLVNGVVTQRGNTRDLIFDIPFLIEYLSGFMTLAPGDVILTGTPEGVVDVKPGDEVVCEIDGIGRLVNTIVDDAVFGALSDRRREPQNGESTHAHPPPDRRPPVESARYFETVNPATQEVLAEVAQGGADEVNAAVAAAKNAFPAWAGTAGAGARAR